MKPAYNKLMMKNQPAPPYILLQLCHTSATHELCTVETLERIKSLLPETITADVRYRKEDFQGNDPVLSRMEISEYTQLWLFAVDTISMEDIQSINAYTDLGGKLVIINHDKLEKNPLKYLDACRDWFENKLDVPSLKTIQLDGESAFFEISPTCVFCPKGEQWLKNIAKQDDDSLQTDVLKLLV